MAESVIEFLVFNLGRLLQEEFVKGSEVGKDVEWIQTELNMMKTFLRDAECKSNNDQVKNWVDEIRKVALDADYVVDNFFLMMARWNKSGFFPTFKQYWGFPMEWIELKKVRSQIGEIKERVRELNERRMRYDIHIISDGRGEGSQVNDILRRQRRTWGHEEDSHLVVGRENDINNLVDWLVKRQADHRVISIVGTPGLGKTTLARKAFNHDRVKRHFGFGGWAHVSQDCRVDEIVKVLLNNASGVRRPALGSEDGEKELRRLLLLGDTYLIVLDDLWTCEAWDRLKKLFPKISGGRILITTRNEEVAKHVDSLNKPLRISLLSEADSRTLFCNKAFDTGEEVPRELNPLVDRILWRCGGLPLAIVVVAGILSSKVKNAYTWNRELASLKWKLNHGRYKIADILCLSFDDLPDYLKPCILYCCTFPEDFEIPTKRLVRLWVAEGFVQEREGNTLEEISEDYLEELIGRNMIQLVKKGAVTPIKSCMLHDLLRGALLVKAKEQRFLEVYAEEDAGDNNNSSRSEPRGCRRVAVHAEFKIPSSFPLDRLSSFMAFFWSPKTDWVHLIKGFKILRVLDLEGVSFLKKLPKEIGELIFLRYLGLRGTWVRTLPKSVRHLHNLQTLDMRTFDEIHFSRSWIRFQAKDLGRMQQLRHLYFGRRMGAAVEVPCCFLGEGVQTNLQTLAFIKAGRWIKEGLAKLKNLRKLAIKGVTSAHEADVWNSIVKLDHLRSLYLQGEMLLSDIPSHQAVAKVYLEGKLQRLPIAFFGSLSKLTLEGSSLKEDPLFALQGLERLRILRLWTGAFIGEEMRCSRGGFPKLEVLEICLPSWKIWSMERGCFPCLRHLIIEDCKSLQMLPPQLSGIITLCELKLVNMPTMFGIRLTDKECDQWVKVKHISSIFVTTSEEHHFGALRRQSPHPHSARFSEGWSPGHSMRFHPSA